MFDLNILIHTSKLLSNVLTVRDDDFLNFVRQEAGEDVADLLEAQSINCTKSLLMTSDVFSVMNIKSKSLDALKKKIGYLQDDDTYVVKPGVRGNVDYLIDLLQRKCIEDAKLSKSSKHVQSSSAALSLNRTTEEQSTTTTISNVLLNNSSDTSTIPRLYLSNDEHNKYIIDAINSWCENNKSIFNLKDFTLIEGQHFFISILNRPDDTIGKIKCCCGKIISLALRRGKYQIAIVTFKVHEVLSVPHEINNQQSSSISNASSDQASSSPSLTSSSSLTSILSSSCAPSTAEPITIPSISTSTLSSSITISSHDCDLRKEQPTTLSTMKKLKRNIYTDESSIDTRKKGKKMRR
ncbi:unnamed protein product [Rotaria sp. Silwood2]|nr:unnamed protein product [Rotaria sp. Silwood2]